MKISTLSDLRKALESIPHNVLERFGMGVDGENQNGVELLCWGEDESEFIAFYGKASKKYPALQDIGAWCRNVIKEEARFQADDESVFERSEPISSVD